MNPRNTLVFAEDDATDAFLLERALRKSCGDLEVRRVGNGEELIQYLQGVGAYADRVAFPFPNVVLLDLKMPGKDGFDVLRWRQGEKHARSVPVVVFSSSSLRRDVEQAYDLGANSFMPKPSDPSRLPDLLQPLKRWWCEINLLPSKAH